MAPPKNPKKREAELAAGRREAAAGLLGLTEGTEEYTAALVNEQNALIKLAQYQLTYREELELSDERVKELRDTLTDAVKVQKENAAATKAAAEAQQEYNTATVAAQGQVESFMDSVLGLSASWEKQTSAILEQINRNGHSICQEYHSKRKRNARPCGISRGADPCLW